MASLTVSWSEPGASDWILVIAACESVKIVKSWPLCCLEARKWTPLVMAGASASRPAHCTLSQAVLVKVGFGEAVKCV